MANKIRLGIPKGSLQDATVALFAKPAGRFTSAGAPTFPSIDDPEIECMLIRAQEMARYVEQACLDVGLTGMDWVLESGLDVDAIADLIYSKAEPRQSSLGARRAGGFELPARGRSSTVASSPPSSSTRQNYFAGEERQRAGRVLLGRNRSEAASAGRRHRRGDGNRIVAAGQSSAHPRHRHGVNHAGHRQQESAWRTRGSARRSRTSP